MKIALLSDDVINQIAAGEVIENPASVVKELIDNAIDAQAKRIEIEILAGGQQLIKVEDDGCGMSPSDVEVSILRHATSKLKRLDDLDSLQTMGFRGEALAAIAAISKIEILTSDGTAGTRLMADAGRIEILEPCARNPGTSIEVRSLFFNTPARRKFQKSLQANSAQVVRIVQSLALSNASIAFTLRSQGQVLLNVNRSDWKGRIEEILGADLCKNGVWLERDHLLGWLGPVVEARATRLSQHYFINRRPIFSPILAKAVNEGYGTRIAAGAHPPVVLYLERPSDEFDVNVHPQKREVRFHDEGRIFCSIRESIQRAFVPNLPSFPKTFALHRLIRILGTSLFRSPKKKKLNMCPSKECYGQARQRERLWPSLAHFYWRCERRNSFSSICETPVNKKRNREMPKHCFFQSQYLYRTKRSSASKSSSIAAWKRV